MEPDQPRSDARVAPVDAYAAALTIMERGPATLEAVLRIVPPEAAGVRPTDDEWSVAEIVAHMVEVERRLRERVEAIVTTDAPPPRRDDDAYRTDERDPGELLALYATERVRSLERIRRLSGEDLVHSAELRRWGRVSAREQVVEWAYHDLEHLRQLLAVCEAFLYGSIGGYMALYAAPFDGLALPHDA